MKLFAYINEICVSCGAHNRWWLSRKGVDSPEFLNWVEFALCPKCYKKEVEE